MKKNKTDSQVLSHDTGMQLKVLLRTIPKVHCEHVETTPEDQTSLKTVEK